MLKELGSGHMLILFLVTNVTAEFWALIHSMLLQVEHRFPNDAAVLLVQEAFVWEFTEIDTISQNLINFLHKITFNLTIWTA